MRFSNLFPAILLLVPTLNFASDGVINFAGRLVDPTCVMRADKGENPSLGTCPNQVIATTALTTKVVSVSRHRAFSDMGDQSMPVTPATHWKLTEITYL